MAKKPGNGAEPEVLTVDEPNEPNLKGFLILSTGEERVYANAKQNAVITGILARMDEIEDDNGIRRVYGILVDRNTEVVRAGEVDSPFVVEPGSLVYVGERYQMKDLEQIWHSPKEAYVYIKFKTQRDIGGGRRIWDLMCAVRPTGNRKMLMARDGESDEGQKMLKMLAQKLLADGKGRTREDDADIPF